MKDRKLTPACEQFIKTLANPPVKTTIECSEEFDHTFFTLFKIPRFTQNCKNVSRVNQAAIDEAQKGCEASLRQK